MNMRYLSLSHVRHLFAIGALAVIAPAQAQQLPAWGQCVAEQVATLDDFRSDAQTIAAAVLLRCRQSHIDDLRKRLSAEDLRDPDIDKHLGALIDEKREEGLAWVSGVVLGFRAKVSR